MDRFGADAGTYLNFTMGSTGSLFLGYYSLGSVQNFIKSGQIRYNGIDNTDGAADLANFIITPGYAGSNDGYYITLASVPEPSAAGLLGLSGAAMLVFRRRLARAGKTRA